MCIASFFLLSAMYVYLKAPSRNKGVFIFDTKWPLSLLSKLLKDFLKKYK